MRKILVYFLVLSIIFSSNSVSYFANNIDLYDNDFNYEESIEESTAENNYEYEEEPEDDLLETESTTIINKEIENFDVIDLETTIIEDKESMIDDDTIYEYEEEPEEDEIIQEKTNKKKKKEYDENIEIETTKEEIIREDIQKEIDTDLNDKEIENDNEIENNNYENVLGNDVDTKISELENLNTKVDNDIELNIETTKISETEVENVVEQIESSEIYANEFLKETESETETEIYAVLETETEIEAQIVEEKNTQEKVELVERSGLLGASGRYRVSFLSDDDYIQLQMDEDYDEDGASYKLNSSSYFKTFTINYDDLRNNTPFTLTVPTVSIISNQPGLTFLYWENESGVKLYGGENWTIHAPELTSESNTKFIGKFTDNRKMMTLTINPNSKVGNASLPYFDNTVARSNFFNIRQSEDNILTRKTKITNENLGLFFNNPNYVFKNWTTNDGTIKKLTSWNASSDIELKANFEFVGYYVYFGEGVVNLDTYYIEKLKKGDTYILPMTTFSSNQDSTLFRWKDVNTNELFEPLTELTLNVDDNMEYEPYFIEKKLVKFNMQNHGNSINDIEVEIGQKITKPTTPTAIGYKFVDWYKEQNFINKWNFDTDVIENITTTLYAKWEENVYDIIYVENGGTYIDGYNKPNSRLYTEPKTYPNGEQIVKTGNNFLGWYENENFEGSPVTMVQSETDSSKKLYARWEPKKYSVTLNINGGEFIENNITEYTYGTTTNLPYNIKSPNVSENFVGWYEDSNFQGEKVSQITNNDTGNKTYYAKYGIVILKLNFNSNGGSGNIQSIDYDYGSNVIIPDNPYSKNGYEFISWIGSDGLNYEPNDEFNIYNDFTLTANWKKQENIDNAKSDTSIERTFLWEEEKYRMWKAFDDKTKEYAKNQWLKLDYAGETKWYHFNDSGYMDLGWIKDNGKYYYLQTDYNNTFGGMLTKVKKINGIIFHFADSGELINIIQ